MYIVSDKDGQIMLGIKVLRATAFCNMFSLKEVYDNLIYLGFEKTADFIYDNQKFYAECVLHGFQEKHKVLLSLNKSNRKINTKISPLLSEREVDIAIEKLAILLNNTNAFIKELTEIIASEEKDFLNDILNTLKENITRREKITKAISILKDLELQYKKIAIGI